MHDKYLSGAKCRSIANVHKLLSRNLFQHLQLLIHPPIPRCLCLCIVIGQTYVIRKINSKP